MFKKSKTSKQGVSLKILLIIELLICYILVLAVISYWRGPVQYKALTEESLLTSTDFAPFSDDTIVGKEFLSFQNDSKGSVIGYAAWLNLTDLNQISVSFSIDCPIQYAGNTLHIDLYNDGYDRDEQECTVTLQGGLNQVNVFLNKGINAPDSATLRFFTLDLADYSIENVHISCVEVLPKVSNVLLAIMVVSVLLLLFTIVALFKPKNDTVVNNGIWLETADWQGAEQYGEGAAVNGVLKKVIHKLIGWYVDPIYQQNAYLREQFEKNQAELAECKQVYVNQDECIALINTQVDGRLLDLDEIRLQIDGHDGQLDEIRLQIDENNRQLVDIQQNVGDLSQNIVSWNALVERMQERSEVDIKQAIIINDYINSNQTAIIYAYRYLLNREPENLQSITENVRNWKKLREDVMKSEEYKTLNEVPDNMPYNSVCVEGITYFFNKGDLAIPFAMMTSKKNWASEDIKNFLDIADKYVYNKDVQNGIFLDIGGNVGTTSIYCKLKIKKKLQYIAFEPISILAKLFKTNIGFNDVSDIVVENIGLSDQTKMNVPMIINHENWGNNQIDFDREQDADEFISITTLDRYIAEHDINMGDIKYIWLDVEGHEPEVLEGAADLYRTNTIPTCIEFNQGIYMEQQKYEKMLDLLKKFFKQFVVCSAVGTDSECLRPINELNMLWDEFEHKSCDLILL